MASAIALTIFVSYFSIILALFFVIIKNLISTGKKHTRPSSYSKQLVIYSALTACSFAHTWYYMLKFLHWSFMNFEKSLLTTPHAEPIERLSAWLENSGLFEQAWKVVCVGSLNWWWSEQLCFFTVGAWTAYIATKSRQHRIKYPWAYMLLGQLVAISVAYNIFNIAILLSPKVKSPPKEKENSTHDESQVPPLLWFSIFLSLINVLLVPFTDDTTFLPNLLAMHGILFLPLLSNTPFQKSRFSMSLSYVYLISYFAGVLSRAYTIYNGSGLLSMTQTDTWIRPLTFITQAKDILYSHPAQSSIGFDVIWTTISFIIWIILNPGKRWIYEKIYTIFASPIVSIGVVAPSMLLERVEQDLDKHDEKIE